MRIGLIIGGVIAIFSGLTSSVIDKRENRFFNSSEGDEDLSYDDPMDLKLVSPLESKLKPDNSQTFKYEINRSMWGPAEAIKNVPEKNRTAMFFGCNIQGSSSTFYPQEVLLSKNCINGSCVTQFTFECPTKPNSKTTVGFNPENLDEVNFQDKKSNQVIVSKVYDFTIGEKRPIGLILRAEHGTVNSANVAMLVHFDSKIISLEDSIILTNMDTKEITKINSIAMMQNKKMFFVGLNHLGARTKYALEITDNARGENGIAIDTPLRYEFQTNDILSVFDIDGDNTDVETDSPILKLNSNFKLNKNNVAIYEYGILPTAGITMFDFELTRLDHDVVNINILGKLKPNTEYVIMEKSSGSFVTFNTTNS